MVATTVALSLASLAASLLLKVAADTTGCPYPGTDIQGGVEYRHLLSICTWSGDSILVGIVDDLERKGYSSSAGRLEVAISEGKTRDSKVFWNPVGYVPLVILAMALLAPLLSLLRMAIVTCAGRRPTGGRSPR